MFHPWTALASSPAGTESPGPGAWGLVESNNRQWHIIEIRTSGGPARSATGNRQLGRALGPELRLCCETDGRLNTCPVAEELDRLLGLHVPRHHHAMFPRLCTPQGPGDPRTQARYSDILVYRSSPARRQETYARLVMESVGLPQRYRHLPVLHAAKRACHDPCRNLEA